MGIFAKNSSMNKKNKTKRKKRIFSKYHSVSRTKRKKTRRRCSYKPVRKNRRKEKIRGIYSVKNSQKTKEQGVTLKTLQAWMKQNQKIKKQNLLTEEECRQLDALQTTVKNNWLKAVELPML